MKQVKSIESTVLCYIVLLLNKRLKHILGQISFTGTGIWNPYGLTGYVELFPWFYVILFATYITQKHNIIIITMQYNWKTITNSPKNTDIDHRLTTICTNVMKTKSHLKLTDRMTTILFRKNDKW